MDHWNKNPNTHFAKRKKEGKKERNPNTPVLALFLCLFGSDSNQ